MIWYAIAPIMTSQLWLLIFAVTYKGCGDTNIVFSNIRTGWHATLYTLIRHATLRVNLSFYYTFMFVHSSVFMNTCWSISYLWDGSMLFTARNHLIIYALIFFTQFSARYSMGNHIHSITGTVQTRHFHCNHTWRGAMTFDTDCRAGRKLIVTNFCCT